MRGEIDVVQDRESFRQQNRLTPEPLPSRQPHTTLVNLVRVITGLDLLHLMNVFNAIEDPANTMSCIQIFVGLVQCSTPSVAYCCMVQSPRWLLPILLQPG
jgi:hypothetical protein